MPGQSERHHAHHAGGEHAGQLAAAASSTGWIAWWLPKNCAHSPGDRGDMDPIEELPGADHCAVDGRVRNSRGGHDEVGRGDVQCRVVGGVGKPHDQVGGQQDRMHCGTPDQRAQMREP